MKEKKGGYKRYLGSFIMESDKYQLKYINQDSNDTERVECSLTRSLSYNTTQLKEFTSNYSEITQSNRCTKAVK
ncbi:hypothetical protein M0811_00362 [Anaeramoeba ignava]|uniref:Uncharacterized protein n=1 Tax=Anaeramoeba ignava TaxID=1746090 RepID=A0A9Q0LQ82_ANAIG|nr:hypothetical protein M0811_00362 [Anaeramoeba ignava]